MWVLRRPTEITQVTCINLNEPFTIGRIECSFNITDDKSVSRRHASITFPPSLILPLLIDCNSKFGTFVNGERVTAPVQLKHGDAVKFGGATSEFLVEAKDFSVYIKSSQKTKAMFRELEDKFGIEVVASLKEAAYFVLDEADEVEVDLISAFLSCKCIVSPSYFSQLLQGNTMSLGLIQPSITSKQFPVDCWLPRRERLNILRNAFEGIKRFVVLGGDKNEAIVNIIGTNLAIETKSIQSYDLRDLKFNELFIVSSIYPDPKELKDPIRLVKYQSIVEAVIRCDGKLIEVSTVYPERPKEPERVVDEPAERKERVLLTDESLVQSVGSLPSSIEQTTVPVQAHDSLSQEIDYKGPSLTAVLPMPVTLLRPSPAESESNGKKPKFVKCHPRHRLPGTIPALFGPEQLQPCRSTTVDNSVSAGNAQGSKRRVLVKDSWLAEDDLVDEEPVNEGRSMMAMIKENRQQKNTESAMGQSTVNKAINTSSTVNTNNSSSTSVKPTILNATPTITPTVPAPTNTPTTTNSNSNSKFQSSFFKNLSKGK